MIRNNIPKKWSDFLFGDREKYGKKIDFNDKDWQKWIKINNTFCNLAHKKNIYSFVNNLGYKIVSKIDLDNKSIIEIGPGSIPHKKYWKGTPSLYVGLDIHDNFLNDTKKNLKNINHILINLNKEKKLESFYGQFDYVFSFYSLEHLHPLNDYIKLINNLLSDKGKLIGSIPNEGGLIWALGRIFSTNKWIKNLSNLNYKKIICWEHPNFADFIIHKLDENFVNQKKYYSPLIIKSLDLNLITSFIYQKINQ